MEDCFDATVRTENSFELEIFSKTCAYLALMHNTLQNSLAIWPESNVVDWARISEEP
jgi:hypothetical protein